MNLIDENIEKESEIKQKKITKFIIIAIAVLILIMVSIIMYAVIKKSNTLKLSVDGASKPFNTNLFLMDSKKKNIKVAENGEIYISVRELSNLLRKDCGVNVEFLNDELNGSGEDLTKCHIKTENESTSYISGSSKIYKVRDNKEKNDEIRNNIKKSGNKGSPEIMDNDKEYEYFEIENGVVCINNEIYASKSAIELGFNVMVSYNQKNKSVSIYTLDGLAKVAYDKVKDALVTADIDYYNKKLLKYGLALIKNSNNDLGIQDYLNYREGNYVLSCKYSSIKFIESLGCFIVTTSDTNEQGVLKIDINNSKKVETLVEPKYDGIYQITNDGAIYAIKENGKYGLLKVAQENGNYSVENILKCEYDIIGMDNYSDYEEMNGRYLINDKYIPIKRDGKWGLANTNGKIIIAPQYDELGCKSSENNGKAAICIANLKNGSDAVVFGTTEVVQEKNSTTTSKTTYFIINVDTKQKIGYDSSDIYATYIDNEKEYVMKVTADDGTIYRINIYDVYSEPSRKNKKANKTSTENKNASENSSN